jgi:uncharacterized protein YkwD
MLITMTALLVVLALGVYGLGRYGPGGYALAGRPGGAATGARQQPAVLSSVPGTADVAVIGGKTGGKTVSRHASADRRPGPPRASLAAPTPTGTSTSRRNPAPSPSPDASPGPTGSSAQSAAGQVLAVINQARAQAGLPAYALSPGLETSSRAHTLVMAGGCGLSHQCPGEPALPARLTQAGVRWTSSGENIGDGGPEPDAGAAIAQLAVTLTQDMLAEKPPDDGHRLNILSSSFRSIGICVYRDAGGIVWMTQDFSG